MTEDELQAKIDKCRKVLEKLEAERIGRLPEIDAKQLKKLCMMFRSDTGSPREIGLNVTFKITNEDSLKAVKEAKADRVDSLNTADGQKKVKNSLQSNVGIDKFHVLPPIAKGEKAGQTPVQSAWRV